MEEWLIIYLIVVLAVLAFLALFLFHDMVLKRNDPGTYNQVDISNGPNGSNDFGSGEECFFGVEDGPEFQGQVEIDGITYDIYKGETLGRHQCFYNSIVTSMKITNGVDMSIDELKQRMADAIGSFKGGINDLAIITNDQAITQRDMWEDMRNLASDSAMNDMKEPGLKASEAVDARVHLHVKNNDTGLITKRPTVYTPQDNPDTDIDIHLLHVDGNHYDFLIPTATNPLNPLNKNLL